MEQERLDSPPAAGPNPGPDPNPEPDSAFEEDVPPGAGTEAADLFVLKLESYEGPIDLLLDQARAQRVDLSEIAILPLAEQYLAFVERAQNLRLELAADYLVMAAWLAYLKSRLLLPEEETDEGPTAAEMSEALAYQLRRLDAVRRAGEQLFAGTRLGVDWHARGAPEGIGERRTNVLDLTLFDLLSAYGRHRQEKARRGAVLSIEPSRLFSVDEAARHLETMLGQCGDWRGFMDLVPWPDTPRRLGGKQAHMVDRSAIASVFVATLELARSGRIAIRQRNRLDPIEIRANAGVGD